jgi:hypothetical protein
MRALAISFSKNSNIHLRDSHRAQTELSIHTRGKDILGKATRSLSHTSQRIR